MEESKFDRDAYLKRIDYDEEISVTIECLSGLHHAQLFTIPFENFDILLGRGIDLEPTELFKKLVLNKRGGYCFELNGLFLSALQSFGFNARALLARVHENGMTSGRGHQLSLITFENGRWIADVGFGGDTPLGPIPLIHNQPTTNLGQTVRLVESEYFGTKLQVKSNDSWNDLYSFDLGYVCPADIEYGNHYTSTSPNSFFTYSRVAVLPVEGGVNRLFNTKLTRIIEGRETQMELAEDHSYIESLAIYFGIELDVEYDKLGPRMGYGSTEK